MPRPPSPDLWITRVDRLAQMPIVEGDLIPLRARIGIGAVTPLAPGQRIGFRTGLKFAVPLDHVLQLHLPDDLAELGIVLCKTMVPPNDSRELILTLVNMDLNAWPVEIRHNQVCAIGVMTQTKAVGPFKA